MLQCALVWVTATRAQPSTTNVLQDIKIKSIKPRIFQLYFYVEGVLECWVWLLNIRSGMGTQMCRLKTLRWLLHEKSAQLFCKSNGLIKLWSRVRGSVVRSSDVPSPGAEYLNVNIVNMSSSHSRLYRKFSVAWRRLKIATQRCGEGRSISSSGSWWKITRT